MYIGVCICTTRIYIYIYIHIITSIHMYMYAYTTHVYMILVHVIYYPGKDDSLDTTGRNHSHAVVMTLVEKLEGKGHHVYMDNFIAVQFSLWT